VSRHRAERSAGPLTEGDAIAAASGAEEGGLWREAERILSPRQYEALWLRYAEDLRASEIAAVTGMSEANVRVTLHRGPALPYGAAPDYFADGFEAASLVWEPEFSLGQLYNKGLFLLGYYGEVNEFARSILEGRPPTKGTLEQARAATRIFEAFAAGPGRAIPL